MSQPPELVSVASRISVAIFIEMLHKAENDNTMAQLLLQQAKYGHSKLDGRTTSILQKADDLDKMAELFERYS